MEQIDLLKMRILLCFVQDGRERCTVTEMARTLREEKYTISRTLGALERAGLVDRSNSRQPVLTSLGETVARRYATRLEMSLNHLLYEGVEPESAGKDAQLWALHCTDETMNAVFSMEAKYHAKYELRDRKRFSGEVLCSRLKDGRYEFPFMVYGEKFVDGSNISMLNDGFEHPCLLQVAGGEGILQFRSCPVRMQTMLGPEEVRIRSVKYGEYGSYARAEQIGNLFRIPASALDVRNLGSGSSQILHGAVECLVDYGCQRTGNREEKVILTVLI